MGKELTWNDGMGSRGRQPWLLFITPDGRIHRFTGHSIPGVAVVVGEQYQKAGKWSSTTYRLQVANGVRSISGMEGWEMGTFLEGLKEEVGLPTDTWDEVAVALGVSREEAERFLREWRPAEAKKLDRVEKELAELSNTEPDYDTVSVLVKKPGYVAELVVANENGEEVGRVIQENRMTREEKWVAKGRVRVLGCIRGIDSAHLRLAVPPGCRVTREVRD